MLLMCQDKDFCEPIDCTVITVLPTISFDCEYLQCKQPFNMLNHSFSCQLFSCNRDVTSKYIRCSAGFEPKTS